MSDLLHHEPTTALRFKYKGSRDDSAVTYDVLLDDTDAVWRRLRYQDMGDVASRMDDLYKAMRARIAERKVDDADDMDQLRKLMQVLAGDEKALDTKIAMHRRMQRTVEERFETRRMHDMISLEHALVTGVDSSGSKTTPAALEATALDLLTKLAEAKAGVKSRVKRGESTNPDMERLKSLLSALYVSLFLCSSVSRH